jgi:hypothetical protein
MIVSAEAKFLRLCAGSRHAETISGQGHSTESIASFILPPQAPLAAITLLRNIPIDAP